MSNIFEGAKFGDKFLTRNGEVAIYHYNDGDSHHKLILERGYGYFCNDNGYEDDDGYIKSDCDVVSRYQEPIDEEKLMNLSNEYIDKERQYILDSYTSDEQCFDNFDLSDLGYAFEAGYRKAIEK